VDKYKPFVSIIYLTKDGGHLLEKSLKAIYSQEVTFDFEVIAVDSGSADGTIETLTKYPVTVYQIKPEEFNFGLTRDYGFSVAEGDLLIAISQDAVPVGTDWLKNMLSPFRDESIAAVQGVEIVPKDQSLFFWEKYRLFFYTRESKAWIRDHGNIGLSFVCCAIRRKVWEENRLGTVEMNEDKVFQKKITQKGYKIILQKEAMHYHFHTYNLRTLAIRCENEGLGWKNLGQDYSFLSMIMDMCNPLILAVLIFGILTFQIGNIAELLFPVVRPIFVFKGNHFTCQYVK
jgi:rhamnosyltransferase